MSRQQTISKEIVYPESDGKPMAETDVHRDWVFWLIDMLRSYYQGQRVYVSGNLLIYFQQGNPKASISPDVFVVKDCDPGKRRIYKIWEEGKAPNCVIETTSKKTRREDMGRKHELYAQLGVPEYFLYDPLGEWLRPALQGFRLVEGSFAGISPEVDGGLVSQQLGIRFVLGEGRLALYEIGTGNRLRTVEERAAEAEDKIARLEKEIARLRSTEKT